MRVPSRVLVTGASGFVGTTLCGTLAQAGFIVRAALRAQRQTPAGATERVEVGDLGPGTDWSAALAGVHCVVHLAARVHVLGPQGLDEDAYEETNLHGTTTLARACLAADVTHFVYLSSVKVLGEDSGQQPFRSSDAPRPADPYARSKLLAEQALASLFADRRMTLHIVRPPLVHGPGVRANFLRLLQWIERGTPLPFGAIRNRRSIVSVWNLCDLVRELLVKVEVPSRTWLVSDGEDLSTPQLVERLAAAMGRRARLWSVPPMLLQWLGTGLGKGAELRRLTGSLQVDIGATTRELGWSPPVSLQDGLARTVRWYVDHRNGPPGG